jgi:glycerophosphoryl diester phosphodiesterase
LTRRTEMNKEELMKSVDPRFFLGICHRGYHNEKDTENGLKAFQNALEKDMAIELDVHLTKDNDLIVIHDSETKRVTGKEGIIEDMTVDKIKKDYKLLDGETIPTLKEVFSLIQEQVPIVIELKVYRKNYKPLAKRLAEELKLIKDKSKIMLISFDPRALIPFKNSGFMRQLLVAHDGKHEYVYHFRNLFEGVDLEYTFLEMKKVQNYHKNHIINIWTVEKEDIVTSSLPYVDTITFQHIDADFVRDKLKNRK